ncbi:MAG: hypothetical protein K0U98_20715 [Deltaproteobacteria bacterium]|nr:hypothetical protein [Deltaproteobacteria bacterium]
MTIRPFIVGVALFALVSGAALASDAVSTSNGLTAAGGPLAIHGYDAVSYFESDAPQRGLAEFSTKHGGAVYRFASRANLRQFVRNPSKYAPRFGGFCAYGVSVGKKFDGDPLVYKVVDGVLYFNLNPEIKKTWLEDVPGNIAKAKKNWPEIRDKAASSL